MKFDLHVEEVNFPAGEQYIVAIVTEPLGSLHTYYYHYYFFMFDSLALRFQPYAPLFLRLGLAAVFLIFGIQKLIHPGQGTAEIELLISISRGDASAMNYYFGLVEVILAAMLTLGFRVRVAALIAAGMEFVIFTSFLLKYGLSLNPDLYRDLGLFGAAVALFLLGAGKWALDKNK